MKSPFKTLVIREIQGAIIDFRFWVVLVLCISIIPLSFWVSTRSYSQQLSDYQQEMQTYRDKAYVYYDMVAEGFRPPSPLIIFSHGLSGKIPYKVLTSREGNFEIEYAKPDNKSDILGEIDFAFIVAFILSLLAILFTFNAISGDKETGMFRLILANPVLRKQVLMAKLVGNYVVFLVPFVLSLLIAILIVSLSGLIPIFSKELLMPVFIMVIISLLFILVMFNLGLWVSALARNSILSVNVLLLIWIVLGLVIPKISPIISATIYPVESTNVYEAKKKLLIQNIENELIKEEGELYEALRAQFRPGSRGVSTSWEEINKPYDEQVKPIREKYEQQIVLETEKLTNDYNMRRNRQNSIIRNISRLSPVYSINNLLAEFSGTGYSETVNFIEQAKQYQATVKQEVYDQFEIIMYRSQGSSTTSASLIGEGRSQSDIPLPMLDNYKFISAAKVFQQNWIDIALLGFYCLLFFVCGFVSFLRFDVR